MSRHVIAARPDIGKVELLLDNGDGEVAFQGWQDLDAIVEACAQARDLGVSAQDDFCLIARIPKVMADDWLRSGAYHDEDHIRRVLNDADYKRLRVWEGQI
jgi:hypothetical protein